MNVDSREPRSHSGRTRAPHTTGGWHYNSLCAQLGGTAENM